MDRASLHNFWRQPTPDGNDPNDYVGAAALPRSAFLLSLVRPLFAYDARILEVGCNAGRNLAYLYNAGYQNVEGVEISPHAVEKLRQTYPELSEVPIHVGAAENVLSEYPANAFDLVFTMAVLEHIHPDSTDVFDNMARIAKHIIAIEPLARHTSSRQYPHNLSKIFSSRGLELVNQTPVAAPDMASYQAFVFRCITSHRP